MFLGFEDVSAKYFSSIVSHVHWVYCAYLLLNSSPPGVPKKMNSIEKKQLMIDKAIKNQGLSAVNQLMTQAKGTQRLKIIIQMALKGENDCNQQIIQGLMAY